MKWVIVAAGLGLVGFVLWRATQKKLGYQPGPGAYNPPGVQGHQAQAPTTARPGGLSVGGVGAIVGGATCAALGAAPAAPLCGAIGGAVAPYAVLVGKEVGKGAVSAAKSVASFAKKLNPF